MAARSLSLREKRLIQAAGVLAIVLLVSLLLRGGGGGAPASDPAEPVATPMPAPVPAAPPPAPVAAAPAQPVTPVGDISQLRLYGLLASGAVISTASGGQRLVPVGREALPGLTLARIEQNHAVFRGPAGEVRLGFDGVAQAAPGAAPGAPAAGTGGDPAQREETLRYRLGLAPRMANGRVNGYTVRPNVEMPALARAGIRPGDVIVSVNGGNLDEERLQELAWSIANSSQTQFEVERGGRRIQLSLQPR
ncbi:MAG TPA: PDZ domain-containing protein [Allosphingosinicella sp.]|nr:PDZ domain-containing protein [Allosphingosinicella sp.]